MPKLMILLLLSLATATPAQAKKQYTSPKTQVHMVELFSTQSCSSCPPAQKWVSKLKSSSQVWNTFIPVVFHVDYWDYLGWKDPYSSPVFSRRQRDYVSEWAQPPAYTPMFVMDGEVSRINVLKNTILKPGKAVGVLKAQQTGKPGHYKVHFLPTGKYKKSLVVFYSILGSGISTDVKAGENEGMILKHDFLNLLMDKMPMKKTKSGYISEIRVDMTQLQKAPEKHIVFWVSEDTSKKPIQIVGGQI